MNKVTQLEDLSNDLFLEIFEYLHALNLFRAFSSLNNRISSILSLPRLHVIITKLHCHHHVKLLSSHLTHHAHQVISVSLEDALRDFSSVISFLFDQHTFINLRSCTFRSICPSSEFHNVIQKLGSFNKLVSFRILQPKIISLADEVKQSLSKTMLTHQSLQLRFVELLFRYDYSRLVANISVNFTVTSLRMRFYDPVVACSIYKILPILRNYRALRLLNISISSVNNSDTQQAMIPLLPAIYKNNPPISLSMKTFILNIVTSYDFYSLNFILRCMPNLRRFFVIIVSSLSTSRFWTDTFKGDTWQRLLTSNTIQLDVFDIFLHINDSSLIPDTNVVVNSFDYFARKYDDWYMAIHRSRRSYQTEEQQICLHGFRRSKKARYSYTTGAHMVLGTLNIHSTPIGDASHYVCDSYCKDLHIHIPMNMKNIDPSSSNQLFKNVEHLIVEMHSSTLTRREIILDFFHIRCYAAENDQKQCADELANLVDFSIVTKLEFQRKNITQIHFIKEILLASSRLVQLKISSTVIFSPKLCDNSSLFPVFHRLQALYLLSNHVNLPTKYAWKLVERFPSLVHLELNIHSVDVSILNILLDGLPRLIHLRIYFYMNTLTDDRICLIDHVIERRRRAFPSNVCNPDEVSVQTDQQIMDIYLSGCSICVGTRFTI